MAIRKPPTVKPKRAPANRTKHLEAPNPASTLRRKALAPARKPLKQALSVNASGAAPAPARRKTAARRAPVKSQAVRRQRSKCGPGTITVDGACVAASATNVFNARPAEVGRAPIPIDYSVGASRPNNRMLAGYVTTVAAYPSGGKFSGNARQIGFDVSRGLVFHV